MFRSSRTVLGQVILALLVVALATLLWWHADLLASGAAGAGYPTHQVARGDSLRAIADQYGVRADELAAFNELTHPTRLYRGQTLTIPVVATPTPAAEAAMTVRIPTGVITYTVQRGDSLQSIARATGVSVAELAAANGLRIGRPLVRNSILIIPSAGQPAPVTTAGMQPEPPTTPEADLAEEEAIEEATPVAEVTVVATAEAATTAEQPIVTATPVAEEELVPTVTPVAPVELTPTVTPIAEEEPIPTATPITEEEPAPTTTPVVEEEPADGAATALLAVADTLATAGDFTTLVAALQATGLTDVLKEEGPFTVFAPTDAAFAALPMGALDALLLDPAGDLAQILLYHVVVGKLLADDLSDGLTLATLQGGELLITRTADGAQVNGANLLVTDIEAANGVIHVIDAVLLPTP